MKCLPPMEIRFRNWKNIETFLPFCRGRIQKISVGDEGCIHKAPSLAEAISLRQNIEDNGFKFGWITSKIPECHIDDSLKTIVALVKGGGNFEITINDIGLLYALYKQNSLPERIFFGRTLSRSMQDCPWMEDVAVGGSSELIEFTFQNNFWDLFKIDFFSPFNVTGIEANPMPFADTSLGRIRRAGLAVTIHLGPPSIAFTRACPIARKHNVPVPACRELCNAPLSLEFAEIFQAGKYSPAPDKRGGGLHECLLLGTVLHQGQPTYKVDSLCECDSLVVSDWQFDGTGGFVDFIDNLLSLKE